jgi:hypothetical protein
MNIPWKAVYLCAGLLIGLVLGVAVSPLLSPSFWYSAPTETKEHLTPLLPIFVHTTEWGEFYIEVAVVQDGTPLQVSWMLALVGNDTILHFERLSTSYDDHSAPVSSMTLNGYHANYISRETVILPTAANETIQVTFVLELLNGKVVHFVVPIGWHFGVGYCADCTGKIFGNGLGGEDLAWPAQPHQVCDEWYHPMFGGEQCLRYITSDWMLAVDGSMYSYQLAIVVEDIAT